jgi:hypothetical protein
MLARAPACSVHKGKTAALSLTAPALPFSSASHTPPAFAFPHLLPSTSTKMFTTLATIIFPATSTVTDTTGSDADIPSDWESSGSARGSMCVVA